MKERTYPMRFSARSKVGIIFSLVAILTVISGFVVMAVSNRGVASHAASSSVTYHGHATKAAKQGLHITKVINHSVKSNASQKYHTVPGHFGKTTNSAKVAGSHAPAVGTASASAVDGPRVSEGGLLHNFAGLTAEESGFLEGVFVLPPDMALCAGHDASIAGNPKVEFQVINLAIAEFDQDGNVVSSDLLPFGVDSMSNFFNEPGVPFFGGELVSDPNCLYDKATDTFFFEAIATDFPTNFPITESHADLVVYNAATGDATEYQFDTSDLANTGCPCLGDQGKLGVDNHAVYISMDEFDSFLSVQNGAEFLAIS